MVPSTLSWMNIPWQEIFYLILHIYEFWFDYSVDIYHTIRHIGALHTLWSITYHWIMWRVTILCVKECSIYYFKLRNYVFGFFYSWVLIIYQHVVLNFAKLSLIWICKYVNIYSVEYEINGIIYLKKNQIGHFDGNYTYCVIIWY